MKQILLLLVIGLYFSLSLPVLADSVRLLRLDSGWALVHVNNIEQIMAPGYQFNGVQLLSINGNMASFSIQGNIRNIAVGETYATPVPVKSSPQDVSIRENWKGQYIVNGSINGIPEVFLIDTGANIVSLSKQSADKFGVPYLKGRPMIIKTASGTDSGFASDCREIIVGSIRVDHVTCGISINTGGSLNDFTLLGMSFLRRVKFRQENGVLTITQ